MGKKITGKEWWLSKTLWIAILQSVAGILVALMTANPELKLVGAMAVVKSGIDILIRLNTVQPLR